MPIPTKIERVFKLGGRTDAHPRVVAVELKPLDVSLMDIPDNDISCGPLNECLLHSNCDGHITAVSDSDGFVLPGMCTGISSNSSDKRGAATLSLVSGSMSKLEYASAIMATLNGKTGLFRRQGLGFKPLYCCRGIAVPVCDGPELEVRLPVHVYNSMLVVGTKDTDNGLVSSRVCRMSDVRVKYGLLIRPPTMTVNSVQAVRVIPWKFGAIGVHISMCDPLHLDFDGDEVHLYFVSSAGSVKEIKSSIQRWEGGKFSPDKIRATYLSSMPIRRLRDHDDFMIPTTLCMSDTPSGLTELHSMCGVKPLPLMEMNSELSATDHPYMSSFVTRSLSAINSIVDSHLNVPLLHETSRQLKGTVSTNKYSTNFTPLYMAVPGDLRLHGLPAMKAVMDLTSLMTQSSLDSAKRKTSAFRSDISKLLLGDEAAPTRIYALSDGSLTAEGSVGNIVYTTCVKDIQDLPLLAKTKIIMRVVEKSFRDAGRLYHRDDALHLATSIACFPKPTTGRPLVTGSSAPTFMSSTGCDFISTAMVENVSSALSVSRRVPSSCVSTYRHSVYVCIFLGLY